MKTKTNKRTNFIDFILNLLIVLSTVWAVRYYYIGGPDALGSVGNSCLKYFTTDSNILVGIAALVMLVFNIRRFVNPDAVMPKWVSVFKYAGTSAVALTFLTVVFFLGPVFAAQSGISGYLLMFKGNVFVLHLTTPLLAIISLLFFERDNSFGLGDCFVACLPSYIYSVVYFTMVVCLKLWNDFYSFTLGGKAFMIPIALIVMYLFTFAISALLKKLRRNWLYTCTKIR